jgi:1-aminocyclopropane-1-carboxylate deaminase
LYYYTRFELIGLVVKITDLSSIDACVTLPSPIQKITLDHWPSTAPNVWVKRDDLIHPVVSGNKWRKLQGTDFSKCKHVISIGGGYSNHLHALGYLCAKMNMPFTALVRGHYQTAMTPMLNDLVSWKTNIEFIDRATYAKRDSLEFIGNIQTRFNDGLFIPEGGSTESALVGVANICSELNRQLARPPTHMLSPVASGATLAGLIQAASATTDILGIAVLKGEQYLTEQVSRFLKKTHPNWRINHNFIHRGYAKKTPELSQFIDEFFQQTQIPIEPVYSGKAFFALDRLITQGYFDASDSIVALHTGGLQGAR